MKTLLLENLVSEAEGLRTHLCFQLCCDRMAQDYPVCSDNSGTLRPLDCEVRHYGSLGVPPPRFVFVGTRPLCARFVTTV